MIGTKDRGMIKLLSGNLQTKYMGEPVKAHPFLVSIGIFFFVHLLYGKSHIQI